MKKLLLFTFLAATSAMAQGRFYIGGSFGYPPPPIRAYGPPPPPPAYGYAYRPPCPGPDYFWIDGFYGYVGNRYAWNPGYWALRPHPRAYWVAPRYHRGNYYHGYWRR